MIRNPAARLLALAAVCALAACGSGGSQSDPGGTESGGGADPAAKSTGTTSQPSETSNEGAQSVDPAIASIDAFIEKEGVNKSSRGWRSNVTEPPMATFTDGKSYYWNITTNKGPIKVKLMPDVAPKHVTSTIYLTRLGFYDDLIFHRVIPDFMAQGGCPDGRGTGGPGYKYSGEFSPKVRHDRGGLLSMANAGPGTDGSQFFLTFKATPWLDGKHTIFGEVVEGMETLSALEAAGSRSGQTREPLKMQECTITVE